MNNPFKEKCFKDWNDTSTEIKTERIELIQKNKPTFDQIIDFVADESDGDKVISKIYFIYQFPLIADEIGWSKRPDKLGLFGTLKTDFYDALYKKTEFKSRIFPHLPPEIQTDDRIIEYLKNGSNPTLNNYHGNDVPSMYVMQWIVDNQIGQIKYFKKEWWTPKLKSLVVKAEPFAITFIPEELLTKVEILNYLKDIAPKQSKYMEHFWRNIPTSFKMDPEIFGRWLSLNGGLKRNYRNIYSEKYYTLEGLKKYFEVSTGYFSCWELIKPEWKKELIDVALPKVFGAIALDESIDLTNSILEKHYDIIMSSLTVALIVLRLHKEGRITPENIYKLKLDYWGIEQLSDTDMSALLSNKNVIDYLIKKKDSNFIKNTKLWKKTVIVKKEHIIDIIISLNFSYNMILSRIKPILNESTYLWVYFETNKQDNKMNLKLKKFLNTIVEKKEIIISTESIDLIKTMADDATYETFKSAQDIFLF